MAVLGAGIMGASTALHLAPAVWTVTVFEQARAPFDGASRWNEGKIHLGFLYAADPALRTARAVLAGGLDFRDQVERLTGMDLERSISRVRRPLPRPPRLGRCRRTRSAPTSTTWPRWWRRRPTPSRYLVDVSGAGRSG